MSWSRPDDLRAQVQRWWDRGELLSATLGAGPQFPRRLQLKAPESYEMAAFFDLVRNWIDALSKTKYCRVGMREINHRTLGKNSVPSEVWIDTLDDAIAFIKKEKEVRIFKSLVETTRLSEPNLLSWIESNSLRVLKLQDEWVNLLRIVTWMKENPNPGIYLRQVDIAGIDSKFIESHRGILSELLDESLPANCIQNSVKGVGQFSRRYGFKSKPVRIRFRVLDGKHLLFPVEGEQDISMDASSFARLNARGLRVFITENEINYLSFPLLPDSMAIFGAGYGFDMFAQVSWLADCKAYYWGDIDTHGLAILSSARAHLPHLQSLLMDEETLIGHRHFWVSEAKQHSSASMPNLNVYEAALYSNLKNNVWGNKIRLEQERIGWSYVWAAIDRLG